MNNKLAILLLLGVVFSSFKTFAQQEAMFSQYMFNTMAINPAYAGSRDVLSMTALGRYQWMGVNGAPKTFTFSMDSPVRNEKMGLGLQATYDELGVSKNTGLHATYAYKIKVSPRTTLSFGVQAGATSFRRNLTDVVPGLTTQVDNAFAGGANALVPNFGGGIYLSNDRSYIGFSCPQIMQSNIYNYNIEGVDSSKVKSGKIRRHYFLMAGIVLGKGNVKVKPSTMLRYTQGAPLGTDLNLNVWLKDKIAFGVSARISQFQNFAQENGIDALIGMLELQLTPQMKIGYAYDFTTNGLNDLSKTHHRFTTIPTHELMLRYEFGFGKNKILTPRYF